MVNAARGRDGGQPPTRIVFDEGHHLFDAADFDLRRRLHRPGGDRAAPLDRRPGGPRARPAARARGAADGRRLL